TQYQKKAVTSLLYNQFLSKMSYFKKRHFNLGKKKDILNWDKHKNAVQLIFTTLTLKIHSFLPQNCPHFL
ncbi:hypothetical protein CTN07_22125, partial [Photobacterium damselae]